MKMAFVCNCSFFLLLAAAFVSEMHSPKSSGFRADTGQEGTSGRTLLTQSQLFGTKVPSAPVNDSAGFAPPSYAIAPTQSFEGTLTLKDTSTTGSFILLSDVFQLVSNEDSAWKHLPSFSFRFVQSGDALVPAQQGLVMTGSPTWNYIIGPGRVWQEVADDGYMRASLAIALVQRNQNCVHNGEMTFLFSNTKTPNVSNVYYQITQETCYPMKFNLWGIVPAIYVAGEVVGSAAMKENQATEFSHQMPAKPLSALATDFPKAGLNLSAFAEAYKHPENITTYGLVINGTNYTAACQTRFGEYAFCSEMRLPSYSIAKAAFAGVALMRLGKLYGPGVYNELIRNYVPQYKVGGIWDTTTFNNASDMATGNYNEDGYEQDEDGPTMEKFLVDETFEQKIADAFGFTKHFAPPGTKWVYQSSATFALTQAMNAYLKKQLGNEADIFNLVRDDIYKPLQVSQGGLTTIRTGNSPTGAPSGYYGLFFIQDDVAKIGNFLDTSKGVIGGKGVVDPTRLDESLFRGVNAGVAGVPIMGRSAASALGSERIGPGATVANSRRYTHGFWGRHLTPAEFPEYSCSFWVSVMAGYGGNLVIMLPNGATFYIFSDGFEFPWLNPVREMEKLAPACPS